ncbi:phage virion morphogenesis protein [Sphingomonas hengshuiensis]|uniref:phage virion morphogenesis protein n=1 Tax=Sphingomonas hengshuiensis TaxID=1609977 RepID=UPI000698C772|nr:phage virion morphogenesis protein [Sphingomonas hengshuiensis]
MAGASFSVHAEGVAAVEARLARLAAKLGDLSPLMDTIGALGETHTQDNFEGQHTPDGVPWAPSNRVRRTAVGAAGPQRMTGKTLQDSRRLYLSITHRSTARSAEWGSNVAYARRHNDGFDGTEAVASHKRTMRQAFGVALAEPIEVVVGAFSRKANTPARTFLGLSAELIGDIEDASEHYLTEAGE